MTSRPFQRLTGRSELEAWANNHDAQPAEIELADGSSMLTFNVDGRRDGEPITWDEFHQRFITDNLSLMVEPAPSTSLYHEFNQQSAPHR